MKVMRVGLPADGVRHGRVGYRVLGLLVAAVIALPMSGCDAASGRGHSTGTSSTRTGAAPGSAMTTSTTVDPEAAAKAEIAATYRAWWADLVAANRDPVGADDRLDDHMTGDALKTVQVFIIDRRTQGLVTRGAIAVGTPKVSVRDRQATATGCVDATRSTSYRDGRPVPNSQGSVRSYTVRFTFSGGWKVTNFSSKESRCVVKQSSPP